MPQANEPSYTNVDQTLLADVTANLAGDASLVVAAIQAVDAEVDTLITSYNSTVGFVNELNTTVGNLNTTVEGYNTNVLAMLAADQTQIDNLVLAIETLSTTEAGDVANLLSQINSAVESITSSASDISALQSSVSAVNGRIDVVAAAINSLLTTLSGEAAAVTTAALDDEVEVAVPPAGSV